MNPIFEKVRKSYDYIRTVTDFTPDVALVLGSGLGEFAKHMEVEYEIPYSDIEDFPVSTVAGHDGRFLFGKVEGVKTVIMKGRVHYYEGYPVTDVVLPTRLMIMLGAKKLILTNAAGAVNKDYKPGDLMLITDHISTIVPSPLIGRNIEEFGTRFPDMSHVYSQRLLDVARNCAKEIGITLREGVYMQFSGPAYETPAEVKLARTLGADAVGMSTAIEAIAANHMGAEICGISCFTNMAAGILDKPLNHKEVSEAANKVSHIFEGLVKNIIKNM
jgi:purine nucleoside phosphorylase I, inosine and guanosine-specific